MAEENKEGKTIVIGKNKLVASIAIAAIVLFIAAFLFLRPPGDVEYIAEDSPVMGISSAPVNVIEFSDYECPYCQAAEGINQEVIASLKKTDPTWEAPVPKIINEYVNTGKVKLVFRQYPVHRDGSGSLITNPALAAKCANEQGNFWDYHMLIFRNYNALSDESLKRYAFDINLNITQFNECFESKKYQSSVQKDLNDGQALGVLKTPTFLIGNEKKGYETVEGAYSFSKFKEVIDSKL